MNAMEAIGWVWSVAVGLRASQIKTLADLVGACLSVERVSIAEIGRRLTGTAAKHSIKRAWRFIANERVHVSDATAGVIAKVFRSRRWQRKPAVIAMDWVEVRNFHTLVVALVRRGRAIPLLWASYREWELHKSQNSLEEGMLRLLKTMLPAHVEVILLADRGFGRTEMASLCQELDFHYCVRIRPDVWVRCEGFRGKLADYPVKRGMCRTLVCTEYRRRNPIQQRVIVHWKRGLPKRRDECWFLMSDLPRSALQLSNLYAQRMTIEEFFRDGKNRRNGFALRNTQIQYPDRFDRLLLILVLAYMLLIGLGRVARKRFPPGAWCSSNRPGECSDFTIGRRMRDKLQVTAIQAFAALLDHLLESAPNWG